MKEYIPIDLTAVRTCSLKDRESKVRIRDHFARPVSAGMSFDAFLDSLPRLLAAEDLQDLVEAVVCARHNNRAVILALGGHVIKCGLQPVLRSLIEADMITAVAMNGSVAIHDFEISLVGATSEDVGITLKDGSFGFAEETGSGMNRALKEGLDLNIGFGAAIGRRIIADKHPFREYSLLATCVEHGVPVTVHVALGTDIIHQHPDADGAVLGEMSFRDFRLLTSIVADLNDGGVWLNLGSAVILPEVFLKALSIARNIGRTIEGFYTANFDMIQHYRPRQNVISRPLAGKGRGFAITGHHEIMIPLFALAVLNKKDKTKDR